MPLFLMTLGAVAIAWAAIGGIAFEGDAQLAYLLAEIASWLCFGIGLVWLKMNEIKAAILDKTLTIPEPKPASADPYRVPKSERALASACFYCASSSMDDAGGRECLRFKLPIPEPDQQNPCQGSFWERRG